MTFDLNTPHIKRNIMAPDGINQSDLLLRVGRMEIDARDYKRFMSELESTDTDIKDAPSVIAAKHGIFIPSDEYPTSIDSHTTVGSTLLVHDSKRIPFQDIKSYRTGHSDQTLGLAFIPINVQSAALQLITNDERFIRVEAGSMYVKTNRIKLIVQASDYIRKATFSYRCKGYLNEIRETGHIKCSDVIIGADGIIRCGNTAINMHIASQEGTFGCGASWESINMMNRKYDPNIIVVSEKQNASHWTISKIIFKPAWDVDVIWAIMNEIVKTNTDKS